MRVRVVRKRLLLPLLVVAASILWSTTTMWAAAQCMHCLWPFRSQLANLLQERAWAAWDERETPAPVPALEVVELSADARVSVDRSQPFVVRGLLNGSAAVSTFGSYDWLLRPPVGDLMIDYFSDATTKDGIVPDAKATVSQIVAAIAAGGPQKIGTEVIFRSFPSLLTDLGVSDRIAPFLGSAGVLDEWRVGRTTTVPVFMATGSPPPSARTDLHKEPIGNMACQLAGRKRWLLVAPEESDHLMPRLSIDGRAYFQSAHAPESVMERIAHVRRRWTVVSRPGDVLWVPTWTWHRVDYLPGETALSASIFHFRPEQFLWSDPLSSLLILPNIFKELVGWKTQ